uniref:Uncharacterized protein n=1 Tax=Anguilla anguilla TaxID=7936 RepID=A0A0E9UHP9_ANGAN
MPFAQNELLIISQQLQVNISISRVAPLRGKHD